MDKFNCKFFLLINILILLLAQNLYSINDSVNQVNSKHFYFIADKPFFTFSGRPINETTKIKPISISVFIGAYAGIFVLQHIGQMNTIWKNQGKFHIVEDGKYAMYIDKAGHFYGTFLSSYVLSQSLIECGFSYGMANALGSLLGLGYTTYVEVLDGFSRDWGFCPSDFYADVAGALFFLAYSKIPILQNITPKFMYFPPRWFNSYSRKPSTMFIDDYSAHTFWLSINVYNLLPKDAKKFFPNWLEISIGFAVRNLCDPLNPANNCNPMISEPVYPYVWGNRKLILALDVDLVKSLPDGSPFWNWFKQSLNYFKFPTPALEIGKPLRFYLFYPFPIKIGSMRF